MLPKEFTEIMEKFGIKPGSLVKVRFGGVVGKISLIIIACLAVLGIIASKSGGTEAILAGCLAVTFLIAIAGIGAILLHAQKHPLEATLEGGEVVALVQSAMAAKGISVPVNAPLVLEGLGKPVDEDMGQ